MHRLPISSMLDDGDNMVELEAEAKRLRVENERLEREYKVAMLKAEIAHTE
jgi:hypothetical protein